MTEASAGPPSESEILSREIQLDVVVGGNKACVYVKSAYH